MKRRTVARVDTALEEKAQGQEMEHERLRRATPRRARMLDGVDIDG